MKLDLFRDRLLPTATLGQLYVDGRFECYILEDAVRDEKIPGETAIPAGVYNIVITPSKRFKRDLPLLLDVPNYTGVRIHPGNTIADTEGCLLPGKERGDSQVYRSRVAFEALFEKLQAVTDPIVIDIQNL